jgi:hypothetical protein
MPCPSHVTQTTGAAGAFCFVDHAQCEAWCQSVLSPHFRRSSSAIVTLDTLLRWYRNLVAKIVTPSLRRRLSFPGRSPRTAPNLLLSTWRLIAQFAAADFWHTTPTETRFQTPRFPESDIGGRNGLSRASNSRAKSLCCSEERTAACSPTTPRRRMVFTEG